MRLGLIAALASIVLSFPGPAASAPDLSARQQELLKQYKSLLELQDLRVINQIVAKDMRGKESSTEGILDHYSLRFGLSGDEALLEEVRVLATAADEAEQGTRFTKRLAALKAMTSEQRTQWVKLRNQWATAINVFQDAKTKKDATEWRRARIELEEVVTVATGLRDLETESLALYHVAYCQDELGDYAEAFASFDKGMDDWLASGRPKDGFYQHMKDRRAQLGEQGFDPLLKDKPATAPTAEKKNSTTSYKEGGDWQDWATEYREMKDPNQFGSTSPWCSEHILLWREFGWSDGAHPFGLLVQAAPFGKPLNVVRDGSKGFFDLDGNKKEDKTDWPCKVIDGKAILNVIKKGEGKDAESYAFFMLSGGQSQTWFQTPVNYQGAGRYRIGCYREGKILGETILLLDDNCTGNFGDPSEQHDNIVRDSPSWIDHDGLIVGKGRPVPWSDVIDVAGKWYHLKIVDPHAKKLRTRELDIQTGQLVLKWEGPVPPKTLVLAEVRDFKGSFFDVAGGKPVTVPVGRYEIAQGRIETGKSAQSKQAWIFKGDSKPIEVKAGETVVLEMGGPYTIDIVTKDNGKTLLVKGKTMLVKEKSGAIIGRIYDEVLFPDVAARLKGGASLGKPQTMSKISTEVFNKDNQAAWFPGDVEIKKSEKAEVEVQLTLKKHALLGGPFTSEWK